MSKATTAFVCLLFLTSCAGLNNSKMNRPTAENPVIAHRGAFKKNNFPENSIAALKEAIRLKCYGSEFDVRMTADDSLIINHDPHYNGIEIEKSTYSQLTAFPLSNAEKLPTLREYLLAGKENNVSTKLVLEIKPSGISKNRGRTIAEKCVALVQEVGVVSSTIYISFDYDILKKILELKPGTPTQYLNGNVAPEQLKRDGITGADYNLAVFRKNQGWIEGAKKNGILLNAWTVNNREDMEWLLANGFQYITTNEPELLFTVLNEKGTNKK